MYYKIKYLLSYEFLIIENTILKLIILILYKYKKLWFHFKYARVIIELVYKLINHHDKMFQNEFHLTLNKGVSMKEIVLVSSTVDNWMKITTAIFKELPFEKVNINDLFFTVSGIYPKIGKLLIEITTKDKQTILILNSDSEEMVFLLIFLISPLILVFFRIIAAIFCKKL